MAVTPNKVVTAQGLISGQAAAVAAKVTYNDATNAVKLITAGPNGMVLYSLRALPRATLAAANQLQVYRSPDGVVMNLLDLLAMAAYTFAVTTAPTKSDFGYSEAAPLRLAPNEQLWVGIATALAGGIMFDATGENL